MHNVEIENKEDSSNTHPLLRAQISPQHDTQSQMNPEPPGVMNDEH